MVPGLADLLSLSQAGVRQDETDKLILGKVLVSVFHLRFLRGVRLEKQDLHLKAPQQLDQLFVRLPIFQEMVENVQRQNESLIE